MRDKLIADKIRTLISTLDEIDELINTRNAEMQKIDLELSEYKNRIITDEDIQEILETPKKKVGRPKKAVESEVVE